MGPINDKTPKNPPNNKWRDDDEAEDYEKGGQRLSPQLLALPGKTRSILSSTSTSNPSNRGAREERAGRATRKKKKCISVRNNEDAKDIARKHAQGASATAPHCSGQETEKENEKNMKHYKKPRLSGF